MEKFNLVIDWIEYVAKCVKAIAAGARALYADWPKRPNPNDYSRPDKINVTSGNDKASA